MWQIQGFIDNFTGETEGLLRIMNGTEMHLFNYDHTIIMIIMMRRGPWCSD